MKDQKLTTYLFAGILIIAFVAIFFINKNKEVSAPQDADTKIEESIDKDSDSPIEGIKVETMSDKEKEIGRLFDQASKQQASKDFKGAKASLEQALKLDPKEAYIMQTYASVLNNSGDKVGAMVWIDKALALQPTEINFWFLKFDLSKEKYSSRYADMNPIYLDAISKTKSDISIITSYASYLASVGKNSEAIIQWQKAITLNPSAKDIYQKEINSLK